MWKKPRLTFWIFVLNPSPSPVSSGVRTELLGPLYLLLWNEECRLLRRQHLLKDWMTYICISTFQKLLFKRKKRHINYLVSQGNGSLCSFLHHCTGKLHCSFCLLKAIVWGLFISQYRLGWKKRNSSESWLTLVIKKKKNIPKGRGHK